MLLIKKRAKSYLHDDCSGVEMCTPWPKQSTHREAARYPVKKEGNRGIEDVAPTWKIGPQCVYKEGGVCTWIPFAGHSQLFRNAP